MSNTPATARWLSLITQSDLDLFAFKNGDISPSQFIIDFAADSDIELAMVTDCLELLRRAPCVARVAEPAAFITYSRTRDRYRTSFDGEDPLAPDSLGEAAAGIWLLLVAFEDGTLPRQVGDPQLVVVRDGSLEGSDTESISLYQQHGPGSSAAANAVDGDEDDYEAAVAKAFWACAAYCVE